MLFLGLIIAVWFSHGTNTCFCEGIRDVFLCRAGPIRWEVFSWSGIFSLCDPIDLSSIFWVWVGAPIGDGREGEFELNAKRKLGEGSFMVVQLAITAIHRRVYVFPVSHDYV